MPPILRGIATPRVRMPLRSQLVSARRHSVIWFRARLRYAPARKPDNAGSARMSGAKSHIGGETCS